MKIRQNTLLLAIVIGLSAATAACAQPAQNTVYGPNAPKLPQPNLGKINDPALSQVKSTLNAIEMGTVTSVPGNLTNHALAGWMEYALLTKSMATVTPQQAAGFLGKHAGDAVGELFRDQWLSEAGKRADWTAFNAAWRDGISAAALKCYRLQATEASADPAAWNNEAMGVWLSGETPVATCTTPLQRLNTANVITDAQRWDRIRLAALNNNATVIRDTAKGFASASDTALANEYAAFLDRPSDVALNWPKNYLSGTVVSMGLAKAARNNPGVSDTMLPKYAAALNMDEQMRGRVLYQSALWAGAENHANAAQRFAAVPLSAYDERLHEARQREAMQRKDWRGVLNAIQNMGSEQRSSSRWTYFEGRMKELLGDQAGAREAYQRASTKAEFHGYLASDKLNQPYTLCPVFPVQNASVRSKVAADPALKRAMMLYQIQRTSWAQREWSRAIKDFSDEERIDAIEMAQTNGWYDRAIFDIKQTPQELALYSMRFPLNHEATIISASRAANVDPEWVAAEIRAESVFNPLAKSPANAYGLMQVIEPTGRTVAARIGEPWNGISTLYDPDANIRIGTAYLRELKDKYGDRPYYAIAGYNAGPAPLNRWKAARPGWDADLWIETISYKETREYVARILSFATIYDWRFNGDAIPVTDRMMGKLDGKRKSFVCPK